MLAASRRKEPDENRKCRWNNRIEIHNNHHRLHTNCHMHPSAVTLHCHHMALSAAAVQAIYQGSIQLNSIIMQTLCLHFPHLSHCFTYFHCSNRRTRTIPYTHSDSLLIIISQRNKRRLADWLAGLNAEWICFLIK